MWSGQLTTSMGITRPRRENIEDLVTAWCKRASQQPVDIICCPIMLHCEDLLSLTCFSKHGRVAPTFLVCGAALSNCHENWSSSIRGDFSDTRYDVGEAFRVS